MQCTSFESNYSSCTGRSSEKICGSGGALRKNERQDESYELVCVHVMEHVSSSLKY